MWSPTSITNTTNIFQHKACCEQKVTGDLPEEFIIRSLKEILNLSKEIIRSLKEIRLLKRVYDRDMEKIFRCTKHSAAMTKRFDGVV